MTLPGDLRVRPARAADGAAIGALMRACDETYLSWAPPGWDPPSPPPDWAPWFSEAGHWSRVAVDRGGLLVGVVLFRPARSRDEPGGTGGELLAGVAHLGVLLVHPSRWREGVGAGLLALAEDAMAGAGYCRARLWTPVGAPAERFYRSCGWAPDGRRGFNPWLGLEVVGYSKPLERREPSRPPAAPRTAPRRTGAPPAVSRRAGPPPASSRPAGAPPGASRRAGPPPISSRPAGAPPAASRSSRRR